MPQIDLPLEELTRYHGSSPRPATFDRFWESALADLDALEADGCNPEWTPAAFSAPCAECYDLNFTGVGGARLHARVVLPTGTSGSGASPVPALMRFHGYSMYAGDWSSLLPYAASGIAVFALDVRGQGGESTDPGGVTGNTLKGHIVRGLESGNPDDLFYRNAFLDTALLARVAAADSRIDSRRMGATGASQGGALALVCAALEPRIRSVWSIYPFLSDYRRVWDLEAGASAYVEIRDWLKRRDPRHERIEQVFELLGHIDVQYLAERIAADVVMVTGLMDPVCPPSSQFAIYNRLNQAKHRRMVLYPDFGHETLPDTADQALTYFLTQFAHGA
jgi:cephalosporin-C deacetylase